MNRNMVAVGIFLLVMICGVSSAISVVPTSDWHKITLTSVDNVTDSGIGLYKLQTSGADSVVMTGVFFQHINISRAGSGDTFADTILAQTGANSGSAKPFFGSVKNAEGAASFFVQSSDTALSSIQESFTSPAVVSNGIWFSGLTGGASGTTNDTVISVGSATLIFADSSASGSGSSFSLGGLLATGSGKAFSADTLDSTIVIGGVDTANDLLRVIQLNPAGKVVADSSLSPNGTSKGDSMITGVLNFETGLNKLVFVVWDVSDSKYVFKTGQVTIGNGSAEATLNADSTTGVYFLDLGADTSSRVAACSVTASGPSSIVRSVQVLKSTSDQTGPADSFVKFDGNTGNFDTRLAGSIVEVIPYDAAGNPVTSLPSGESIQIVITYNFAPYSQALVNSLAVLHLDHATQQWEALGGSFCDSNTQRCTAVATAFSHFGIGNVAGHPGSSGSGGCVIQNALGSTVLAGVMPSIRDARDMMMSSSIGRMLVSGYYSVAGIALLLFGAGALAFTGRRRN